MEGYAQTASFMHLNSETAIFRHFGRLSVQNLLYLQAELVELEHDLGQLVDKDKRSSHPNCQYYARDWYYLSHSERDGDATQWEKVLEIRAKLKEYHSALEKHAFFLKLGGPSTYDLQLLQGWILEVPKLVGQDHSAWNDAADLVALGEAKYDDPFSRLIRRYFLPMYHRCLRLRLRWHISKPPRSVSPGRIEMAPSPGSLPAPAITPDDSQLQQDAFSTYDDARLVAIIETASTVVSSLLPISSILILYFVTSLPARLGIMLGYTALFSLALAIFTKARKVEIFSATSAFAAVQVVFISSTGGSQMA